MVRSHSSAAARARLTVAVSACLFGTSATAARAWAPALDPVALACWRVTIGGSALVAVSWAAGCAPWRYRTTPRTIVASATTVVGFQVAYFVAADRMGVAQATLTTIGTGPLAAGVIDHARGRALLTGRWLVGIAVAIGGVALMVGGSVSASWVGWGSAVSAGCAFPVYAAIIRDLGATRPDLAAAATVFGSAAPVAAVVTLTYRPELPGSAGELVVVGYLGLVATALAYVLWSRALRTIAVRDTVVVNMLEPVTAT
ncbi:MAG: EamA family transporter, partial [Actinobacteria bacterium]|nr:EamA family transporter [Actinomycetota bacterium]